MQKHTAKSDARFLSCFRTSGRVTVIMCECLLIFSLIRLGPSASDEASPLVGRACIAGKWRVHNAFTRVHSQKPARTHCSMRAQLFHQLPTPLRTSRPSISSATEESTSKYKPFPFIHHKCVTHVRRASTFDASAQVAIILALSGISPQRAGCSVWRCAAARVQYSLMSIFSDNCRRVQ